jgi:hypothetical protein
MLPPAAIVAPIPIDALVVSVTGGMVARQLAIAEMDEWHGKNYGWGISHNTSRFQFRPRQGSYGRWAIAQRDGKYGLQGPGSRAGRGSWDLGEGMEVWRIHPRS